jgi:hypothetical protein
MSEISNKIGMVFVVLGLLLLVASPYQRPSFNGEWSGTTSQNHTIIVTVEGTGKIISVYIEAEIGTQPLMGYNTTDFDCYECYATIDEHGNFEVKHANLVMDGDFTGQGFNGTYELTEKSELFNSTSETGTFEINNAILTKRANTAFIIYPIFVGVSIGMLIIGAVVLYIPNHTPGPKVITVKKGKGSYKPQS